MWLKECIINNKLIVKFRLDTGADCNILPAHLFNKLNLNNSLIKPKKTLRGITGHKIKALGVANLNIKTAKNQNFSFNTNFYVMNVNKALLSLDTCIRLKLIERKSCNNINNVQEARDSDNKEQVQVNEFKIDKLIENYKDVFDGLGCSKEKYTIKLNKNAIPIIHPPRKVPFAIQDKLKNKLQDLE